MKKILIFVMASLALMMGAAAMPKASSPQKSDKKITPEIPDLEQIRAEVNNPKSPYYYPKLMERYERNETVMNLADYRHLYYGQLFQEDFNPYRHSEASTRNEALYYKQNHTRAELDSIIIYAEEVLSDNPFNLSQMNFLIYALRARGKGNKASIWQYRLNHLLQAIVSTGTGADPDNAWYVIDPRHEYNIINFQNAVAINQQYEEPYFDRIEVEKKGGEDTTAYYFNIRNLLEEYYRKFPE